jgi:DNA-binding PadR family transcriptional regulator
MSDSIGIELPPIDDLLHEPKGNLSVQMNKLGDANMVKIDKSFQGNRPRTMYELTAQGRKALREYKKNMNAILAALPD